MTLRIVLVAMVSALGLTLPTRSELPAWCQSAELWASKRLADWDTCERSSVAQVATGDSMMVRVAYWEPGRVEAIKPAVALKSAASADSTGMPSASSIARPQMAAAAKAPTVAAATNVAMIPRVQADAVGTGGRTIGMGEFVRLAQSVAQRGLVRISALIGASPRVTAVAKRKPATSTVPKALSRKSFAPQDAIGERVLASDNLDVALFAELEARTQAEAARFRTDLPSEPTATILTAVETEQRVRDKAGPRRVALRVHLRRSQWVVAQRLAGGASPRFAQNHRRIECAPKDTIAIPRPFSEPSKPSAGESAVRGGDQLVETRTRPRQDLGAALPDLPTMVFAPDVERSQPELPAMVFAPDVKQSVPELPAMVSAPDVERSNAPSRSPSAANVARKTPINRGESSGLGHAVDLTHQAIHAWMAVLGSVGTLQITSR